MTVKVEGRIEGSPSFQKVGMIRMNDGKRRVSKVCEYKCENSEVRAGVTTGSTVEDEKAVDSHR